MDLSIGTMEGNKWKSFQIIINVYNIKLTFNILEEINNNHKPLVKSVT